MGRPLCVCLLLCGMSAAAFAVEYQHGYAFLADPKYPPDFAHFDYINPDAPKGGVLRIAEMGTWDNFNEVALGYTPGLAPKCVFLIPPPAICWPRVW